MKWETVCVATFTFAAGTLVPASDVTGTLLRWTPFVLAVIGAACGDSLRSKLGWTEPEPVLAAQGRTVMAKEPESQAFFITDCAAVVTDPVRKVAVTFADVKAPTLAMFVKHGWVDAYSWRAMRGKTLPDGLGTRITQPLWTKLTGVMAECHLAVKEPGKSIKTLYQPGSALRFVRPYPMPSNWTGWWN